MKKLAIGILSATFILGAGTYAFAQGNGDGILNFEQMKPYMQKMHPNFSENELKDMYESCHGSEGKLENKSPDEVMNKL
ncbi:hypothetical protein RRV45_18935 [Bacillus sp. DTU_2020_1000418_1_SI_GHA_SEK_038]|uniref:hypothetical protein n=1 Tax=Bacillus sp. DTU_2020_1000418_1_SI_GHA_SEK_038 TaxID=3077585 RepID=UPI0028F14F1B|nr:hypothetical protein [Bacillus sp. DTU_2020_1000418_1_SI_GHA_SEK_038]WNS74932.1 hypothetical protein RRV45_18935 [Bacillus sp. DTU_2020_1000418_1_SI_GHA_SEK_038]